MYENLNISANTIFGVNPAHNYSEKYIVAEMA
jgi:hypothetical protein